MSAVQPSPLPETASAAVGKALPSVARPLGFNCPACGVMLTIPNPTGYDGRPAPCPQCAVLVVPPRVFQPGADEAELIDLHPLPGLSGRAGERIKMPRAVHRRLQHCVARSKDEAAWVGGVREGVVMSGRD